ncbi:MAG: hypothetical protein COW65_17290 [Cytophagales bacterium CG18_big_fil_WC_8_21_14_2_50_42_9]|nr:MAG: hypothetical protein COW65_17290 [Cytophagales bacterium CG18_big_fil_WC_8_21_14_2_50_42_9]
MKTLRFYIALFLLTFALNLVGADVQAQCAMCKTSVVSSNANNENKLVRFGSGLNKGILYLMAIPYVLAGTVGFLWYRYNRKQ